MMRFLSPFDDFAERTLSVLGGLLDKLHYLGQLRGADGKYQHWGLTKTYGSEATQKVIRDIHVFNYLQCLRTPLRVLWEESSQSAKEQGLSELTYLKNLADLPGTVDFGEQAGGSARHFNAVLLCLEKLAHARPAAVRPAA